jgi:hypothetical protein
MNEIYQYIGYAGSALIGISLMMKNILRLRTINLFGAATFATYGLLVGAYPVFFLNSFITLVDIYYLSGMLRQKEHFSLMPVLDSSHRYLSKFLDFYAADIKKFFPDFDLDSIKDPNCFFILRNLRPTGVFVYETSPDDSVFIHLDYAIPDYRDLKNAKYVYSAELKYLKQQGVNKLVTTSKIDKHVSYLLRTGFERDSKNTKVFVKKI